MLEYALKTHHRRAGLLLRFDRAGRQQDFEWRTKPLGLVFSDSMPMTVTDVHEEAEHMGVRVGDVLTGYGSDGTLVVGDVDQRVTVPSKPWMINLVVQSDGKIIKSVLSCFVRVRKCY